jgi:hypothetical protein
MPRNAVLALLLDGARADVLGNMAAVGDLPNLKRHFVDRGGLATATSVFPTAGVPAHLPLLTGLHPGSANLPGTRWVERPTAGRGRFWGRTHSYGGPLRRWQLERDVPRTVATLFAHVPNLADVNTELVRGCARRARLTRWSKPVAYLRALFTREWAATREQAERAVLTALERGFPSVHAVFPAIDELGHRAGPLSPVATEAYRQFDRTVGRIVDALARQRRADDTLIVITSDHGQSATKTHVDLVDLVRRTYPRTLGHPVPLRHCLSAQAAVMVSGHAMANVYVVGAAGWHERPNFEAAASQAAELKARLLEHPGIEHVIYRGPEVDSYVLANREGRLRMWLGAGSRDARLHFVVEGKNPLGYAEVPASASREEIARRFRDTNFPDAPWQIAQFFKASRAGDLVVCARHGFDLRARFAYPPQNGSRGGLHRDHMLVPALVNGRWARDWLRTVDLFPSILAALGRPVPPYLDGEIVGIV